MPTSSEDIALSVKGISKSYTITHQARGLRAERETFWALQDISFRVAPGEVVGVIGRNGAGKSTLLKILSRITEPSAGRIELYGRVGSLLEVGTGFHPELTGRENIYLNGAVLGMRRREINRQFDAIVEFAGVDRFLDTPVKRYSSGMYVRLAFAVAAHLEPEILIVDEVLAVGDAAFQKKCLGKMEDVAHNGRTVLFVSHNMAAVQHLCSRCLLLENGRIVFDGDSREGTSRYLSAAQRQVAGHEQPGEYDLTDRTNGYLDGRLIARRATLRNAQGAVSDVVPMGEPMTLVVDVDGLAAYADPLVGFRIKSESDETLIAINSRMKPMPVAQPRQPREQVILRLPHVPLTPGSYWIEIILKERNGSRLDFIERAVVFHVVESDVFGTGYLFPSGDGYVFVDSSLEIRPGDDAGPSERIVSERALSPV